MFESLSSKLDRSFKLLKGQTRITEINIAHTLKDIRRALLDADVNFKTAKEFTNRIKEKAIGQKVLTSIKPGQLLVKIVRDELAELMGSTSEGINLSSTPSIILLAGLQGSGKTTFAAKLANHLKKQKNKHPLLVACDIYRPAAIEQLQVLGRQIEVEVYAEENSKNPIKISRNGIKKAKNSGNNVVIIDTAGRLSIDELMMKEIAGIAKRVQPDEILFVVDSMTGQDAVNTAKEFNNVLDFQGVVLTKLDGDTKGGAALSIKSVVDKPIKFISAGEKMDAIDVFHPDRMADRILGMGDIVTLVEKAQQQIDEKEARRLQKKFVKNQFNFNDFLKQINQIKKMGSFKDIASMIPGVGKQLKNLDINDDAFKNVEAIIHSMTPEERENPQIINGKRRIRLAKGSGTSIQEVNKLIKQFAGMRKMMRNFSQNKANLPSLLKNIQA